MTGFFSGFMGENITDMGQCGVQGVSMIMKTEKAFANLFHGKLDTYVKSLLDLTEVI